MWVWNEVIVDGWLKSVEEAKGQTQKHAFQWGKRYTFIISKTFTWGRYGHEWVMLVYIIRLRSPTKPFSQQI